MNNSTVQYALIGEKLKHSFSPNFFNKKFKNEGIEAHYSLLELDSLDNIRQILKSGYFNGCNVTIPYKTEIRTYLDQLSIESQEIGAVNTVEIQTKRDGSIWLIGHNTDCIGFEDSLLPYISESQHKKALIFGTGGASKAVEYVLRKHGIRCLLVSRTPQNKPFRVDSILSDLLPSLDSKRTKLVSMQIGYHELTPQLLKSHTLLINTTPVGMFPNEDVCIPIPYHLLTKNHLCYDLIYNPIESKFLKNARINGAQIKNGLEMLIRQAEASYKIWTT